MTGLSWILAVELERMTEMLAASGYDMIGVDNSEEMLEIAMEKKVESPDMIFCIFFRICGSLNYMERCGAVIQCLRFCELYYRAGGSGRKFSAW